MDSLKLFAIIFVIFFISGTQSKLYKTPNKVTFYIDGNQRFTYYDAFLKCNSLGMALLTLNSKETFADFHALFPGSTPSFWTSAHGFNKNYAWTLNGKRLIPSLWCPSQPLGTGACVKVSKQCYGLEVARCDLTAGLACEERVKEYCCEKESVVFDINQNNTCKSIS